MSEENELSEEDFNELMGALVDQALPTEDVTVTVRAGERIYEAHYIAMVNDEMGGVAAQIGAEIIKLMMYHWSGYDELMPEDDDDD